MMAAQQHVVSENPYHYSFNICAGNALNTIKNSFKEQRGYQGQLQGSPYSNYLNNSNIFESEYHCDLCDRSFRNDVQLKQHVAEHITCGRGGCKFTAHPKVIDNHVRMQHKTGIFNQIKKLDNPEEVKKWLEERKRKYPTQKNIDYQKKLEAAQKKRGETIQPDNSRFNRHFTKGRERQHNICVKSRGRKQKQRPKNRMRVDLQLKTEFFEEIPCNGGIQGFKGIGYIEEKDPEPEPSKNDFHISDDEEFATNQNPTKPSDLVQPANKSLALLMASYGSEDDSESEGESQKPEKPTTDITKPITADDDEPPEEVRTVTSKVQPKLEPAEVNNRKRKMPFNHVNRHKRYQRQPRTQCVEHPKRRRKPTLLQKLLHNQVVHEQKVILDCIKHIVQNNFFDASKLHVKPALKSSMMTTRKKPTLLQGLLKNEIIRERNIILQCIRHIVSKKFLDSVIIKAELKTDVD